MDHKKEIRRRETQDTSSPSEVWEGSHRLKHGSKLPKEMTCAVTEGGGSSVAQEEGTSKEKG